MKPLAAASTWLETDFSLGVVRDVPRSTIPTGGLFNAVDYLVDQPGVVRKRGGTAFASNAPTGQVLLIAVAAPEYPGDPRLVVIGTDGAATRKLFDVTSGTAATGVSVNGAEPTENPTLYVDKLIITDGVETIPYPVQKAYLSGGVVTVGLLGGTPPVARVSCVHLSHLVLANSVANPNRLWFSPIPDIETAWDTANAYIDVPEAITGLASVDGVLIVFCRGSSWRILGQFPPGSVDSTDQPNDDMQLQPLGAVGCIDARSIVKMNGRVYFADESGVYSTGGSDYESITYRQDGTGIAALWASSMSGFAPANEAVVCAGVHLNKYLFLTIRHPDGRRYQFLYFEPRGSWVQLADAVTADMYATRFAPNAELYACGGDPADPVRLLALSGLLTPTSSNTADANGETVLPILEFRTAGQGPGLKHYDFAHVTYDMRDPGTNNPTLAVTQATGIEASSFTAPVEGGTLAETTDAVRARVMLAKESQALTLRMTQTNPSSKTEVYAVEYSLRTDPLSMDGQ